MSIEQRWLKPAAFVIAILLQRIKWSAVVTFVIACGVAGFLAIIVLLGWMATMEDRARGRDLGQCWSRALDAKNVLPRVVFLHLLRKIHGHAGVLPIKWGHVKGHFKLS